MHKIVIYGIYDPSTDALRYIGQAKDLEKRYKQHLTEARCGQGGKLNDWVRFLLSEGKTPEARVLITCNKQHANVIEHRLIARFASAGYSLLNGVVATRKKYLPLSL